MTGLEMNCKSWIFFCFPGFDKLRGGDCWRETEAGRECYISKTEFWAAILPFMDRGDLSEVFDWSLGTQFNSDLNYISN